MRNLYARFVLWLIRPALKAGVIEIMLSDARYNGPYIRATRPIHDEGIYAWK